MSSRTTTKKSLCSIEPTCIGENEGCFRSFLFQHVTFSSDSPLSPLSFPRLSEVLSCLTDFISLFPFLLLSHLFLHTFLCLILVHNGCPPLLFISLHQSLLLYLFLSITQSLLQFFSCPSIPLSLFFFLQSYDTHHHLPLSLSLLMSHSNLGYLD